MLRLETRGVNTSFITPQKICNVPVSPRYIIGEGMQNIEDLVKRSQKDENAFKEVYDFTIDRVFNYVLLRVRNRNDAKEVAQEIYLSFWKSLTKFKWVSEEHFYGFLWKIVKRRIIKFYSKKTSEIYLEEIYDIPQEEEVKEDYRFLLKHLSLLKEKDRLVLELRYFENLTFGELSKKLGISESNAKVIHHRALIKLKNNFKDNV